MAKKTVKCVYNHDKPLVSIVDGKRTLFHKGDTVVVSETMVGHFPDRFLTPEAAKAEKKAKEAKAETPKPEPEPEPEVETASDEE